MPYFTLRDIYGTSFQLTSSEPDVIAGWLLEHARKASSVNSMLSPVQLTVMPICLDYQGQVYDWPPGGGKSAEEYLIQAEQLMGLANVIVNYLEKSKIKREDKQVAAAEWCDFANHPFKAGQTGTMRAAIKKEDGSLDERVICPECAALMGVNDDYKAPQSPADRKAAIEAAKPGK